MEDSLRQFEKEIKDKVKFPRLLILTRRSRKEE
ncbi:hypothetical protein RDI58_007119 [Solanum bulbocastanum]|uniref:Uncharacterized protein n=1 Tax=Solanum bulbocastanum TaxID=147425 RepID=A0AAN8TY63_SOLBU